MKKPNIDFSKQGIKSFLLHHVEKLILGLGVVLLGVFFWLGYSVDEYDKQTPEGLVDLSQRARSHIVSDASWDKISEFRKADDDAHIRIQQAESSRIPATAYPFGYVIGTPAKKAGMRKDPETNPAEFLMAKSFPAAVLLKTSGNSELNKLELAEGEGEEDAFGGGDQFGGGGLPGDRGDRGGRGGRRPDRASQAKKKTSRDDGVITAGDYLPEYQRQEIPGIRPQFQGLSPASYRSWLCNVTAVTGLVRFQNQLDKYNKVLASARGYYPKRDRPIYQYMQIQKQEEGKDWVDVTEKIMERQVNAYTDPVFGAPEVVDPENYDEVLTSPIPTMTQIDYRDFAVWPLPDYSIPENLNAKPGFEGIKKRDLLAYGGDVGAVAVGEETSTFEDPFSAPAADDQADRPTSGGNRGGRDRGGRDRGGRGGMPAAPRGGDRSGEARPARLGSNRSAYDEIADALHLRPDYKLVRFFDIETVGPNTKPKKVRYRVKLWLADPNNENPNKEEAAKAGKRDRGGSIGAGGGSGAGLADDGPPGGAGGGRDRGGSSGPDSEPEDKSVYVPVTEKMLHPSVRARIDQQKANPQYPEDRKDLEFAVSTEWSEPTDWITVGDENPHEVIAGSIVPPKETKIGDNYVERGEPAANVVAAAWNREYGIRVPANREARRSDVLNFSTDAHILHPIDWTVRKLPEAEIETDAMVVDILGGDEIRELSTSRSPIKYHLPGEVLIMGDDGQLIVKNDIQDKPQFFQNLFLEDEIAEIGGKKKKKDDEDNDRDRGRGGGDAPDF